MKTYKLFTEGLEKWKDVKNPHVKKEAGKMLKALDKDEVLAYSAEHGEFTIFKNEMEYIKAQKGKGKAMKWLKVEGKSIDGQKLEEAFSFKGAVKHERECHSIWWVTNTCYSGFNFNLIFAHQKFSRVRQRRNF